ncbi:MAG: restriction endonuclease subunit S [Cyanobacteria bacterium P01_A01_bin.15]
MMTFPMHEQYKDSDFEWIGEIPSHWEMKRSKYLFAERDERKGNQNLQHYALSKALGLIPHSEMTSKEARADSLDKYKQFQANDLVMNKMQAWNGIFGYASSDGVVSPDYTVFRGISDINVRFYHYLYKTDTYISQFLIESRGMGDAFRRLHTSKFGVIASIYPPREEQDRIVEFLDRKTAEIDDAIATKQRLIELLQEQKAILINQAVTKGLDPNVPMCDLGTDWLGQVPKHWKVGRLKILMKKMDQGWSPQCSNYPANDDQWGIVKVGCVNGYQFNPLENKTLPPNLSPIADLEIKHHDILISRANTLDLVGSAACALHPRKKLMISDKTFRVLADITKVEPEFFVLLLQAKTARRQIEAGANGASASMQNIGRDVIRNLWAPIPPLKEQKEILKLVNTFSTLHHQAIDSVLEDIRAVEEFRKIIIAKTVTGKIKV